MGNDERKPSRKPREKKRAWREGDRARISQTSYEFDVARVSGEERAAVLWSADDGRAFVASFCERVAEGRHVNDSPTHYLDGVLPP